MSTQLKSAFEKIIKMPYFKNEHAHGGISFHSHEAAVVEILKSEGYTEIPVEKFPKLSKSLIKKWADCGDDAVLEDALKEMNNGEFINQPAGSQAFPDALVKDFVTGKIFVIECKSTKKSKSPMWNDSLPKQYGIYVFCSQQMNQTTVFLGKDVINQEIVESEKRMNEAIDEVVKSFYLKNKKDDIYNRGWKPKHRRQNFQAGKGADYFSHPDRKHCENNVLEYVR